MRHGFVDYTSRLVRETQDPAKAYLTEKGKDEATAAGLALRDIHFDLAIYSGLTRTRETAEIVLDQRSGDLKLEKEPRFSELRSGRYIDFKSAEQLAATMTFQFESAGLPGATFLEGGEAFCDAMERIEAGLVDLLARPNWHTALVVAHEVVNRLILAWALKAPLGASAGFEQDTGCINILDFDLVPDVDGTIKIERALIKAVNLTPANFLKNGMNQRSLEAIFTGSSE